MKISSPSTSASKAPSKPEQKPGSAPPAGKDLLALLKELEAKGKLPEKLELSIGELPPGRLEALKRQHGVK